MSSNIISIVKNDDGTMTIKSWGTVDIRDKANQRIPIEALIKDIPYMMANKPKTHWNHTDIEVGFIKDLQVADKVTKKEGIKKGIIVTSEVPGNRMYLKKIQKQLEKGKHQMSIRGFSYNKFKKGDEEILDEIEAVNYAWVPKGCNYEADMIEIDGKQIKKNDDELYNTPEFMKEVQRYMEEGISYQKAFELAKELYTSMVFKEDDSDEEEVVKYIEQRGKKWVVLSHAGKVLGKHDTRKEALEQLKAVEVNKGASEYSDKIDSIKADFKEQFPSDENDWKYVERVGDTGIVVENNGKKYKVNYTRDKNGRYTFQSRSEWTEVKPIYINKGDEPMADEIEAMKKELEELKKSLQELNEQHTSLVKEKEAIEKERDGLKSELEGVKKDLDAKDGELSKALSEDRVREILKEDRESIKKEVMEELAKDDGAEIIKALGYTPFDGANMPENILKGDDEKNIEFFKTLAKAVKKGDEILKNGDIDSIPSLKDMEKSLIGGDVE